MRVILETGQRQQLLIFRSQKRCDKESLWTKEPYKFSIARHIVWLIVEKIIN